MPPVGGSVPPLGDRARRTAPAQCRQGAGRTRVGPAGAPAGLGPVSTGGAILVRRWTPLLDERIEGPRERRPRGEPRRKVPAAGPARTIGPCRCCASPSSRSRRGTTSTTTSRGPRRSRPRRGSVPTSWSPRVRPVPRLGGRLPRLRARDPRPDDGAVRTRGPRPRHVGPGGQPRGGVERPGSAVQHGGAPRPGRRRRRHLSEAAPVRRQGVTGRGGNGMRSRGGCGCFRTGWPPRGPTARPEPCTSCGAADVWPALAITWRRLS